MFRTKAQNYLLSIVGGSVMNGLFEDVHLTIVEGQSISRGPIIVKLVA